MIITLAMNPAIDKTLAVDDFKLNHVNKIETIRLDAAGKGINVSKVVKVLGGRTKVITFLGGNNGEYISNALEKDRISFIKIPIGNETRINTKIVDKVKKTYTDLNEIGPEVTPKDLELFIKQTINYASSDAMVVLTGSVPLGIENTIYRDLIEKLKGYGVKTILDASGPLFAHGVELGPFMVKPNIHELENYFDRKLQTKDALIEAGNLLLKKGIEVVVISLGEKGALLLTPSLKLYSPGLKVDVKSTVGAGDAMVAGLCYGLSKNIPMKETFALAIASSAAQITVEGSKPPTLDLIYKLIKDVVIEEIEGDYYES